MVSGGGRDRMVEVLGGSHRMLSRQVIFGKLVMGQVQMSGRYHGYLVMIMC